jgi:hypothetical protein
MFHGRPRYDNIVLATQDESLEVARLMAIFALEWTPRPGVDPIELHLACVSRYHGTGRGVQTDLLTFAEGTEVAIVPTDAILRPVLLAPRPKRARSYYLAETSLDLYLRTFASQ